LETRLQAHVQYLAGELGERNVFRYASLERARLYIEEAFTQAGYPIRHDAYEVLGRTYRNVIAEPPASRGTRRLLIVGAHYDTAPGTPGADDNASAVAVLLELARLLADSPSEPAIRWVAFTLEEPPFYRSRRMGSRVHARRCRQQAEPIAGMISLEMVGYYSDQPGSQSFPLPLMRWFYPRLGNFIAVIGNWRSRRLVRRLAACLSETGELPVARAAFPLLPGPGLSDNWSFWKEGYPAAMVTDTAFFRNPHYHRSSDLPETLDYPRMAALVAGLENALRRGLPCYPR
jgi:Zn-dependent M28 family amino/carboxypeptidase